MNRPKPVTVRYQNPEKLFLASELGMSMGRMIPVRNGQPAERTGSADRGTSVPIPVTSPTATRQRSHIKSEKDPTPLNINRGQGHPHRVRQPSNKSSTVDPPPPLPHPPPNKSSTVDPPLPHPPPNKSSTVHPPPPLPHPPPGRHPASIVFKADKFTKIFLEDQHQLITSCPDGRARTGTKTDLRISCQDGHLFVHRAVIESGSQYFQDLLEGQQKEETAEIFICGYKMDNVKAVLNVFYVGYIPIFQDKINDNREIEELCQLFGIHHLENSQQSLTEVKNSILIGFSYADDDDQPLLSQSPPWLPPHNGIPSQEDQEPVTLPPTQGSGPSKNGPVAGILPNEGGVVSIAAIPASSQIAAAANTLNKDPPVISPTSKKSTKNEKCTKNPPEVTTAPPRPSSATEVTNDTNIMKQPLPLPFPPIPPLQFYGQGQPGRQPMKRPAGTTATRTSRYATSTGPSTDKTAAFQNVSNSNNSEEPRLGHKQMRMSSPKKLSVPRLPGIPSNYVPLRRYGIPRKVKSPAITSKIEQTTAPTCKTKSQVSSPLAVSPQTSSSKKQSTPAVFKASAVSNKVPKVSAVSASSATRSNMTRNRTVPVTGTHSNISQALEAEFDPEDAESMETNTEPHPSSREILMTAQESEQSNDHSGSLNVPAAETEDDAMEQIAVGEVTPEVVTPEVVTGEVTPEVVTPEELTPQVVTQVVVTGEVTPEVVTQEVVTGEVTPEVVTPEEVTGEVTPEVVTPEEVTPEVVTQVVVTGEVTPEVVTQVVVTGEVTPEVVTQVVVTGEVIPEVVTQELTLGEVISQQVMLELEEDLIREMTMKVEFDTGEVITGDVVPEEVIMDEDEFDTGEVITGNFVPEEVIIIIDEDDFDTGGVITGNFVPELIILDEDEFDNTGEVITGDVVPEEVIMDEDEFDNTGEVITGDVVPEEVIMDEVEANVNTGEVTFDEIFTQALTIPRSLILSPVREPLNGIIPEDLAGIVGCSGNGIQQTDDIPTDVVMQEGNQGVISGANQEVILEVNQRLTPEANQGLISEANQGIISEANQGLISDANQGLISEANQGLISEANQGLISGANQGIISGANQVLISEANQGIISGANQGLISEANQAIISGANQGIISGANQVLISEANQGIISEVNQKVIQAETGNNLKQLAMKIESVAANYDSDDDVVILEEDSCSSSSDSSIEVIDLEAEFEDSFNCNNQHQIQTENSELINNNTNNNIHQIQTNNAPELSSIIEVDTVDTGYNSVPNFQTTSIVDPNCEQFQPTEEIQATHDIDNENFRTDLNQVQVNADSGSQNVLDTWGVGRVSIDPIELEMTNIHGGDYPNCGIPIPTGARPAIVNRTKGSGGHGRSIINGAGGCAGGHGHSIINGAGGLAGGHGHSIINGVGGRADGHGHSVINGAGGHGHSGHSIINGAGGRAGGHGHSVINGAGGHGHSITNGIGHGTLVSSNPATADYSPNGTTVRVQGTGLGSRPTGNSHQIQALGPSQDLHLSMGVPGSSKDRVSNHIHGAAPAGNSSTARAEPLANVPSADSLYDDTAEDGEADDADAESLRSGSSSSNSSGSDTSDIESDTGDMDLDLKYNNDDLDDTQSPFYCATCEIDYGQRDFPTHLCFNTPRSQPYY